MSTQTTHRFGGYENLNLTQAEIAARAYDAGLPPSDRPINAYQGITWTPCRLMVGTVPTEYGVAIDAAGLVLWRDPSGVVTSDLTVLTGFSLFALPSSLGVGFFNSVTGVSTIAYAPTVFINLPVGSCKFIKSQAIEHDYWNSRWGAGY